MIRWYWHKKPPLVWTVLWTFTFTVFAAGMIPLNTLWIWAWHTPSNSHPVRIEQNNGYTYYVGPVVGWIIQNFLWVFAALLGAILIVSVIYRRDLKRI